jgi:lactate dehydrogenase-like 2-hydroxyacid dehydrogenase
MIFGNIGQPNIVITNNGGHSAEALAELALAKIIKVGQNSHPVIVAQAEAFKDNIRQVLIEYLQLAQEQALDTASVKLTASGHGDIASFIRRT